LKSKKCGLPHFRHEKHIFFLTPVSVARWYIFNPKIRLWVNFGRWKMFGIFRAIWSILRPTGIFYGHFGTFCGHLVLFLPVLVCCTEKNLATLSHTHSTKVCELSACGVRAPDVLSGLRKKFITSLELS
jgi:hypothetical protein